MNTLTFITTARPTALAPSGDDVRRDHQLSVVGYSRNRERCYLLETVDPIADPLVGDRQSVPALFAMNLTGQYAGRVVPISRPANENDLDIVARKREVLDQVADLAPLLRPLPIVSPTQFGLATRVVRRSAVNFARAMSPVRKFVVKVTVIDPQTGERLGNGRQHHLSTYLSPKVSIERVFAIPNRDQHVVILSYLGLPNGLGDRVEEAILLDSST